MNLLNKIKIVAIFGILAAGSVFGQSIKETRAVARPTATARSVGKISTENANNYFVGYDFDLVARYIKKDDKFRESIAQMTILWDELYSQPEAADIEALMRMTVRGQGSTELQLAKLEKAKESVEKRLTGEGRWYYNVGLAYSQMFTALDAENMAGFKQALSDMNKLSKGSPAGTPVELVSALSKIGSLLTHTQFGDNEAAIFKTQCDSIDKLIAG
jgi:hypothetical protein